MSSFYSLSVLPWELKEEGQETYKNRWFDFVAKEIFTMQTMQTIHVSYALSALSCIQDNADNGDSAENAENVQNGENLADYTTNFTKKTL